MQIQLVGPTLPTPKLNIQRSTPPTPENRAASASRRAADLIASIDAAIGAQPCAYCQSDLYEEHPPGPCPACGKYEQRAKAGDRPPLGVPIEYTTGRIIGVR